MDMYYELANQALVDGDYLKALLAAEQLMFSDKALSDEVFERCYSALLENASSAFSSFMQTLIDENRIDDTVNYVQLILSASPEWLLTTDKMKLLCLNRKPEEPNEALDSYIHNIDHATGLTEKQKDQISDLSVMSLGKAMAWGDEKLIPELMDDVFEQSSLISRPRLIKALTNHACIVLTVSRGYMDAMSAYLQAVLSDDNDLTAAEIIDVICVKDEYALNVLDRLYLQKDSALIERFLNIVLSAPQHKLSHDDKRALFQTSTELTIEELMDCVTDSDVIALYENVFVKFDFLAEDVDEGQVETKGETDEVVPIDDRTCRLICKQLPRSDCIQVREIMMLPDDDSKMRVDEEEGILPSAEFRVGVMQRLNQHIQQIFDIAKHEHQACSKGPYYVTRLSSPEFSFYTSSPLSQANYFKLLESIEAMAKTSDSNIHLLLSSFVINIQGVLINVSLYVVCGESAHIYQCVKNGPAINDPAYGDRNRLFQQRALRLHDDTNIQTMAFAAGITLITSDQLICVPVDDQLLQLSVTVCLDHRSNHSWQVLSSHFKDGSSTMMYAPHIDQMLTSNTIAPNDGFIASTSLVHVDPCHARYAAQYERGKLLGRVDNPEFGSSVAFYHQGDHAVGQLLPALERKRRASNRAALEHRLGKVISNDALLYHIKRVADDGKFKYAAALLQLVTVHCPLEILQILFYSAPEHLSAWELDRACSLKLDLAKEKYAAVAAQASVLTAPGFEFFMQDEVLTNLSSESVNQLALYPFRWHAKSFCVFARCHIETLNMASINAIIVVAISLLEHDADLIHMLISEHLSQLSSAALTTIASLAYQLEYKHLDAMCSLSEKLTCDCIERLLQSREHLAVSSIEALTTTKMQRYDRPTLGLIMLPP